MIKRIVITPVLAALLLTAFHCSFYIPGDWDAWPGQYRIILDITPEDSSVYLNGKLIGLAYEFATPQSALKLSSLRNELYLKKAGYVEKALVLSDHYDFYSRTIVISENLMKSDRPLPSADTTQSRELPPEYRGEKVPVKEEVDEKPLEDPPVTDTCRVSLTFSHADASIFLDGRFIGISPESKSISNLSLTAEKHHLVVFKPGYQVYRKTIDLSGKDRLAIDIKLVAK